MGEGYETTVWVGREYNQNSCVSMGIDEVILDFLGSFGEGVLQPGAGLPPAAPAAAGQRGGGAGHARGDVDLCAERLGRTKGLRETGKGVVL